MLDSQPFLASYDLLLFGVGVALLLTTVGFGWLERLNVSKAFVYLAVGLLAGPLLLDLAPDDPLDATPVLERVAELGVIISLVVIGIRIGRPISWSNWQSTVRLILIVMPLTIAAVALSGAWLLGLALGPAILLGAILAPTDPVMAGALEEHSLEDEREDRFGLSTEAGFNDGFAFPFVYLGLYLIIERDDWQGWLAEWVVQDLLWAIAAALPLGWIAGQRCGRWYLSQRRSGAVSHKRRAFIPLALLLAVYGLTEAIGAYGFLSAFTVGLGFRRAFASNIDELEHFTNFNDALDDLIKAVVLIMLGALVRWDDITRLGWPLLAFVLVLLVVIRPGLTLAATAFSSFRTLHRLNWAWFGIRGIGSLYYLTYALNAGIDDNDLARTLLGITFATVLASSLLHGITLRPFLTRFAGEHDVED
jgi:sodium/hydrogen antiporter